jgi:hypothetical protein
LRDKPKSGGRPTELPKEIVLKIRKKLLSESKHGWNTKQVNDIIIVKEGRVQYHYTHMYADCSTSGVLNRKCQERYTCQYCI